ncbi:MAG TPA: hypothetical protein VKB05_02760 [Pyrinomonadaceae bacterium]|nr:hypothetical protein [Pyrinomonadaceae bacterium]
MSSFILALILLLPFQQQTIAKIGGESVSPTPPKEGIVDQSFLEPTNSGGNINERYSHVGQTYIAGITGRLTGVNIDVISKRSLNPGQSYQKAKLSVALYTIEDLENSIPGILLGEVTVDDESPLSNLITFPEPIEQIKGKKYAIVVHYVDAPAPGVNQWLGQWYGSKGNIGGERIVGDGTIWKVSETKYTSHFRTYVAPRNEH